MYDTGEQEFGEMSYSGVTREMADALMVLRQTPVCPKGNVMSSTHQFFDNTNRALADDDHPLQNSISTFSDQFLSWRSSDDYLAGCISPTN